MLILFWYNISNYSSGFYCESKNQKGKMCKDYKVRFCCIKKLKSQWGNWGKWSECTKKCGGGKKFRIRECNANSEGSTCRNSHLPHYSKQEQPCNLEGCQGN